MEYGEDELVNIKTSLVDFHSCPNKEYLKVMDILEKSNSKAVMRRQLCKQQLKCTLSSGKEVSDKVTL